jgi:tight adherence protein B
MSQYLPQIAAAMAGLAVLFGVAGYALILERQRLDARLQAFIGAGVMSRPQKPSAAVRPRRNSSQLSLLLRLRLGAQPLQLWQAGSSLTPRRFAWLQLGLALVAVAGMRVLGMRFGLEMPAQLALMTLLGTLAMAAPHLMLRMQRSQRLGRFELQFASALDSVANSIQVGLSVPQALEMVSRDMPAPLGPEFGQVLREMGMGLGLGEALDHLADRVPLQDVQIFAAAVNIQYHTGGHLSGVLHTIAGTVRQRVNLRGEIRSLTAQQRMSAYIVGALPIVLALALKFLSPEYFNHLLEPGLMRVFVILASVGIVAGFHFMLRIADIEV